MTAPGNREPSGFLLDYRFNKPDIVALSGWVERGIGGKGHNDRSGRLQADILQLQGGRINIIREIQQTVFGSVAVCGLSGPAWQFPTMTLPLGRALARQSALSGLPACGVRSPGSRRRIEDPGAATGNAYRR